MIVDNYGFMSMMVAIMIAICSMINNCSNLMNTYNNLQLITINNHYDRHDGYPNYDHNHDHQMVGSKITTDYDFWLATNKKHMVDP